MEANRQVPTAGAGLVEPISFESGKVWVRFPLFRTRQRTV